MTSAILALTCGATKPKTIQTLDSPRDSNIRISIIPYKFVLLVSFAAALGDQSVSRHYESNVIGQE
jgi:hypothetical protein